MEDVTPDLRSANEHSNFDHSTTEPYSSAYSPVIK